MANTRGASASIGRSKKDRHTRLLECVLERERVDVSDLAALLGVSQVTVRKDLDELSRAGLLRREHGFAVAGAGDDMKSRLAFHHDLKRRIAEEAARTVADGDTVLIESGSVCALLAQELCQVSRGVTIVTNSAFIADFVRDTPFPRVVLLGGLYQPESQVVVGPLTAAGVGNFFVEKFFLGVDGYTPEAGFGVRDLMRAEAARAMGAQAREVIVLSESAKFPSQAPVHLMPARSVARVFTDDSLAPEMLSALRGAGVVVTTVPASA